MSDFIERFGDNGSFSDVRQGTIVGLLCIGTLIGCLISAKLADTWGRRLTISFSAFFYIIGVVIEITSSRVWAQFAMGRFTAGLGIGALSTVVPMYQSESIPKAIRSSTVASYQLFITLGIWTAYMVNWGTESKYHNSAQWRIPNGLSALWAILLGFMILLLPESPRYAYRKGREDEARATMGRLNGVAPDSDLINEEIREIQEKIDAETAGGDHPWYECFTGPRMLYRTILGMVLQAGQQLTGANYFFYYGTTIFSATGLSNSYVTSIILGTVNVAATIVGLWLVENVGRRKALMGGAAWMFICLFIYAFVGHYQLDHADPTSTPQAGNIMIVFTCLFICAFATTWGPLVWAIVGELYPARYRAVSMALATASNWLFNFLISFFSTMITSEIDYLYGLVFGGCCFALFFIVYFFVIETKDRSLEEIDTMYILHVNPITSAKWNGEELRKQGLTLNTDNMYLAKGGRNFSKSEQAGGQEGMFHHQDKATTIPDV
ncbi:putative hexose transporter hxt13 [Phaeomoniella chlamydospora]|uniref:Putative hexose transporter hxt13 n=1 Tax=Phaeomoniella chlamydospora TaxID=158046 RepID=A0A0G2DYG6_PHACM|nr:putative hexose transporter hxt13 [Phaeomoniella chlamydospora]